MVLRPTERNENMKNNSIERETAYKENEGKEGAGERKRKSWVCVALDSVVPQSRWPCSWADHSALYWAIVYPASWKESVHTNTPFEGVWLLDSI